MRISWQASFLTTLTLIAVLGIAGPATALTLSRPADLTVGAAPASPASEEDEGEEEGEVEASEDQGFEIEECEAGEAEECEEEADVGAPGECLLSSADATVVAIAKRDRLRLQIRYVTLAPTTVAVDYGLHGARGSLHLGAVRKRFGKRGVLRLTKELTPAQMAKVMAAKDFTVRLRVAAAPDYCQTLFERRLNLRRTTPAGVAWSQSG